MYLTGSLKEHQRPIRLSFSNVIKLSGYLWQYIVSSFLPILYGKVFPAVFPILYGKVFPAVFHVYLMVRFMCFMPHIMWTNAMYPLSAPLWQLTCPRAHTHHLHNIIRTFSLIKINERSVFRPPESNVRLYNTLQIHVIWCCRRCNNLKRKKVDLVRPFEKWFVTTICK